MTLDASTSTANSLANIVPSGNLQTLRIDQLRPNPNNPRRLFDPEPLRDLRENIREHGVLVPITVYQIKGQDRYAILDGERRFRSCQQLAAEGIEVLIPANVVHPPTRMAGMLYMFAIHNFRESWELMPTALSLEQIMMELGEKDESQLQQLTGLSDRQLKRCLVLLSFPKRFRDLSLLPDPTQRIPSNFWIELHPVLDLYSEVAPDLVEEKSRDGLTDLFVEKYREKRITSIIHFRRVLEAYEAAETYRESVVERMREYVLDVQLETRAVFDEFIADRRRLENALRACFEWQRVMDRTKVEFITDDREALLAALRDVADRAHQLAERLDAPAEPEPKELSKHQ